MRQFDVFDNPIPAARRTFPYLAVLQSDLVATGADRVVAPVTPRASPGPWAGRLVPLVTIQGRDHALLVPGLTTVRARDLRRAVGHIGDQRDGIVAALDYLFLGV